LDPGSTKHAGAQHRVNPRILIAAADDDLRAGLCGLLASHPHEATAAVPLVLLTLLARKPSVRVLILAGASAETTLELLAAARTRRPDVAVLVLCARPTLEAATEAMRRGAEDVLPIPCAPDVLRNEVVRLLEVAGARDSLDALQALADSQGFDGILSRSAAMRPVFERARAASRSDTPVLIVGETGTGKELVARAIHANGRRAARPFVPVNCAALPKDLFESELFGHRRGAFSGAQADYPGLFVSAHGGTLFLDEIGELPPEAQPKLLRVLQDGEVRPVGGLESRRVDTRIIAASNRTLSAMADGVMRQDLFFRLSVLVIDIPPLRARMDDLPLLVQGVIRRLRGRGVRIDGVDPPALDLLALHDFPGNVRELENLVEGVAVTLVGRHATIGADDVRSYLRRRGGSGTPRGPDESNVLPLRLDELEAWAIGEAMRRTNGNKRQAAQLLGISRDTLYRKLGEAEHAPGMPDSRTLSPNR
jgi:two-component system, NtrC family, response regulator AtoC